MKRQTASGQKPKLPKFSRSVWTLANSENTNKTAIDKYSVNTVDLIAMIVLKQRKP